MDDSSTIYEYSDQVTVGGRGRDSDQATMIGRLSEQSPRNRYDDEDIYDYRGGTSTDQGPKIGRNSTRNYERPNTVRNYERPSSVRNYERPTKITNPKNNTNSKSNQKSVSLAKIVASRPTTAPAKSISSNTTKGLTVIPMTKKQYQGIPEDKTTVMVHTKPAPNSPKTKIITVRKEISTYEEEDVLGLDCDDLCNAIQNGPFTFRFATCLAACLMIIGNCIDYSSESYYDEVSFLYTIVSLYVWMFALFIITLEIRPFHMTLTEIHRNILNSLRVLRFSWGRGFVYFFSGSLQFCLLTKWNMIGGGTMMLMGIFSVCIGQSAHGKLDKLVRRFGSRENIMSKFNKYDVDRDGYLNPEEMGNLVASMDVRMSFNDFVAVFTAIDRNCDRLITREDLNIWWVKVKGHEKNKDSFALPLV